MSCSLDSSLLTGADPGDLFIIRNVANLVPPYEPAAGYHTGSVRPCNMPSASLQVEHIIVLGHSQCGGIAGLMNGECDCQEGEFLGKWVRLAEPAKNMVCEQLRDKSALLQTRACEQAAIMLSLDNLLTFPWLRQRVESKFLFLHGWHFDIQRGELLRYSPDSKGYVPLVQASGREGQGPSRKLVRKRDVLSLGNYDIIRGYDCHGGRFFSGAARD